jgi:diguanylate cyclase (GGDEF)-like protein
MKNGLIRLAALAMFALFPLWVSASDQVGDVAQLLQRAEEVRSTDPAELAATLAKLDQLKASATPAQQRHLRLLHAYQQILTGRYSTAMKEALAVHDQAPEPELKFRSSLLIANTAAITRDFSLGLRYLEDALSLQDQIADKDLRHLGFVVAAILYNQYGQYSLGQHYAEQVLAQDSSPRNRCFAQHLRLESLFRLGVAFDNKEVTQAIANCEAQREPIASNILRSYYVRRLVAEGETKKAIELLEAHLGEVEATKYPWLIGEIHSLLAQYYLTAGDLDQSKAHAESTLERGDKSSYLSPVATAHKVLYEIALKRNDLARALDEYRLYAEVDKAQLDEVKAREFAFQLSRHELQQKNQAIELLSRQNDVLTLQQEVAKKSAQNNQLLVAMLLMVLGVGAYWAYKIKRVQVMFRRQAQVDSLTGVSNRGHFRAEAEAQLVRSRTNAREASLVLLDLDNFKHINDRYGHATGDWVLTQVAAACRAACREGDLFGRLGGEEFAILTCGGDLNAAERVAQQCRANLAAIDTSSIDGSPSITASFGCASTKLAGHSFESLFMHADRAMYRAKAEGRDRICTHEEGPVAVRLQASA